MPNPDHSNEILRPSEIEADVLVRQFLQKLNYMCPGATLIFCIIHPKISTVVTTGNRYTLAGLLQTVTRQTERQIDRVFTENPG